MLDYAFSHFERVELAAKEARSYTVPVVGGVSDSVRVTNPESASFLLATNHGEITAVTELNRFYYAPIRAGDVMGQVCFYHKGALIATVPLVAQEGVDALSPRPSLWRTLFGWLMRGNKE